MGVVYKARQLRPHRLVALKVIRTGEHASEKEVTRFRAEAEAVAQLNHPNIVALYEVSEHAGRPYFSLEYVEGGSLDKVLKSTPQSPVDSARLVRTLALAMQVPHQATPPIIHRDLKPANVLLALSHASLSGTSVSLREAPSSSRLNEWTPKITDFGLAKQLDGSGETVSGTIVGTPSYMSPEQAEGRIKDLDPRTDIYSLGAILYECLTGRPPFKGQTLVDTLEQVRTQEPVAPSRLEPKLPRDLETVCLKCLQKEPRRRYGSARELADDLERFLDDRPVLARPVSTWERGVRWARRKPAQAALVAALLALLLVGAAGTFFFLRYNRQQLVARLERLQYDQELRLRLDQHTSRGREAEDAGRYEEAKQHWDQALATLEASPGAAESGLRRRIEEGRQRARRHLDEQAAQRALAARRQDFQNRLGRFEAHRDQVLFHAVSLREQDAAADAAFVRREAPAALEQLDLKVADRPEALATGLRGWRPLASSPAQYERLAADCYQVLLLWAEAEAGTQPKRALQVLDAAVALARPHGLVAPRLFHLRRARVLDLLGDKAAAAVERDRADTVKTHSALDAFQTALEEFRKGHVQAAAAACEATLLEQADHFWAQYVKALCNLKQGHWEAAKVGLLACLARRPQLPAPLLALCGLAQGELKEFAAAEAVFARALKETDPATRAYVLTNRSIVRIKAGRWDDARQDLLATTRLQPAAYQGYVNLAQAHEGQQQYEAALEALDKALTLSADAAVYYTRARLHARRGDRAAARRDFEQVVARPATGRGVERLASARVELAHFKHQDGEYDAALEDCEAALKLLPKYAPAHLQRGETLLALSRPRAAGKALDAYLASGGKRSAKVYRARGLIHVRLEEHAEAVEAFSQSLLLQKDGPTLAYRGWEYLGLKAPELARRDFEAALNLDPKNADALCGRGLTRVQLNKEADRAPADAEAALRVAGRKTWQLLLNCARIHAQTVGRLRSSAETRDRRKASYHQHRATELLRATLEKIPTRERAAFWRKNIEEDTALRPVRNSETMQLLAQTYAR
jgi:tetratricopeptide (TPR) repeat protein